MKIRRNYPLRKFATMAIGGPAKFFVEVRSENELREALDFAEQRRMKWCIVGEGSNLIVADKGYKGVIIRNKIEKFDLSEGRGGEFVTVGAGNNLLKFIFKLNSLGLAGLERMAGIPGTVGGAIYGCAGAYGQEIKDHLVSVRIFDGRKFKTLSKKQCQFGYRESVFKKRKNWVILEATFRLGAGERGRLSRTARDTIKLREKKYWPGLKCPGSFFKNIRIADIRPLSRQRSFLRKIDSRRVMYGKVPAGYLLEEVKAKGKKQGSIRVASHHANLIYNPNGGKASDVVKLATRLRKLVKNKFGITIEEEVRYL